MTAITFEPQPGERIEDCCEFAALTAAAENQPVQFNFNDIGITAQPGDTTAKLVHFFHTEMEAAGERYQNSPAGKKAKAERDARIVQNQDAVTAAIRSLPGILQGGNLDHIMGWLRSFAHHADDVAIDWKAATGVGGEPMEWLCLLFESKGFREAEFVGDAPASFNTRERLGRYVIGQAIQCMRRGMPPHPVTDPFCDDYFKLPSIKCSSLSPSQS